MSWKKLFPGYILERGYDYYDDDKVYDLQIRNNVITAYVEGTEEYEVEITIKGNKIDDMYCSCPHAESGNNCKHMAAVLIAYFEDEEEKTNDESLVSLVNEANIEDIKKFLITILEENDKLRLRFKNTVTANLTKIDMDHFKNLVDMAIVNHSDYDCFIDYYSAFDFFEEIMDIINNDVRSMLDNKNFDNAFELTNYIFTSIGNVEIDDSDGYLSLLFDECYRIWEEIIKETDIKTKETMFNWFITNVNGEVIDYMTDYIEDFLYEYFTEDIFLDKKLKLIEKILQEVKSNMDSWSNKYYVSKWVVRYLNIMENLGKEKEVADYYKKYWQLSDVRKLYIEKQFKQKNYDEAIKALKESIVLDKEYPGLVHKHSLKLKDIYRICGMKEEYLKQLWQLILKDAKGDLDVFKELKKQYSNKEWIVEREKIFTKLSEYHSIDILYKEEKLYDRLLSFVLASNDLTALFRYEDILIQNYSQEVLGKYQEEVEKMAIPTSNRKTYQYLISLLQKMKKIPGGKAVVDEIVEKWRNTYRNRKAMMDELNKL